MRTWLSVLTVRARQFLLHWVKARARVTDAFDGHDVHPHGAVERRQTRVDAPVHRRILLGIPVAQRHGAGAAATLANIQLDVKQLQVDYVDLLLLHGPCHSAAQINAMWSGAEEALKAGIVKSIGVSNFNAAQLAEIKGTKPAANQCYMTMGKHDQATIDYCLKNGIAYEAYDAMKGCECADSLYCTTSAHLSCCLVSASPTSVDATNSNVPFRHSDVA